MSIVHGIRVHGDIIYLGDQTIQVGHMIFFSSPAPRCKIIRTCDPQISRQLATIFQRLKMPHPLQNNIGLDKIADSPFHHGFITYSDDFYDIRIRLCQINGPLNFSSIGLLILRIVIWLGCPCIFAVDPGT